MIQPAHVAAKKWNGICTTATTFILKTDFVSTSMSCLHASFRDTIKTPIAFNNGSQTYLFTFLRTILPRLTNYTTFFSKNIPQEKKFCTAIILTYIIIYFRWYVFFLYFGVPGIKHVDLSICYSGDVKTRVVSRYTLSRKVGRWKDELVNGSFTRGSRNRAHPPSKSRQNLARPNDPHNCIVMRAASRARSHGWFTMRKRKKKEKSQRDCATRGESLGTLRECRALRSPIHLQRRHYGTVDGIAFSRTRTVRCVAIAPKLGHSGAK